MVTEKYDDPEADVLKKTRESVGEKIPIVLVHDLHGNISESWLEYADVIIGYKTAPHMDEFERGVEGGRVMVQMLKGLVKPTMALRKPRILIGGGLMTVVDQPLAMVKPPMYKLMSLARRMEQEHRIVNVTVAGGFGHADVPRAGMGIVVTTDGDQELAEAKASELADLAWSLREDFLPNKILVSAEIGMKDALASVEGPVILADEGDNVAGGGPGDATHILKALKDANWPDAALIIRDAMAVREVMKAGIGSEVNLQIGGKSGELHGKPVEVRGIVKALSDGTYIDPRQKTVVNMGNSSVLRCGECDLLLTERAPLQANPGSFQSLGIDPRQKKIVVVKSAHAFRLSFERFAKLILEIDTPGVTSPNVSWFKYRNLARPIYPLDSM
jgi:microcystin degradation protein MlrC